MNTSASRAAPERWWYGLVILALALGVCLQLVVVALNPQGFLSILLSLSQAPAYASSPYNVDMRISLSSSPEALYTSSMPNSYVISARDGSIIRKVPERLFAASQGLFFTLVFMSDLQGGSTQVRAYRQRDAHLLWTYTLEHLNGVKLIDGTLYLNTGLEAGTLPPGLLLALNAENGRVLWRYNCAAPNCYIYPPQALNGVVYTREDEGADSNVVALQASTGAVLWRSAQYFYGMLPFAAGNQILVQSAENTIAALNSVNGRPLWQQPVNIGRL